MSVIATIRGELIDREPVFDKPSAEVIVDVGGVGYRLTVTGATLGSLPSGGEVLLHVHHHFWEADQKLFGFATKDERIAFEGLLAAHKVGPALALAIIATHPPARLAQILDHDDIDALCEVPGVGKKTAQRLLVDLKSSLVLPVLDPPAGGATTAAGGADASSGGSALGAVFSDVRSALAELGYGPEEIKVAMAGLMVDEAVADAADATSPDTGELLKRALRILAGA